MPKQTAVAVLDFGVLTLDLGYGEITTEFLRILDTSSVSSHHEIERAFQHCGLKKMWETYILFSRWENPNADKQPVGYVTGCPKRLGL